MIAKPLNPYDLEAGTVVVVHDITERRRAAESLRESEERFSGFAKASGYGFAMGKLSGQLIFGNSACLRIVEEEREADFIANTFYHYYSEEDKQLLIENILPTVMAKGQWKGEFPLLTAKGNLTPTEQNIFLISDEHGNPRMVGNIITDITSRKRAEEALRVSEDRYRMLVENVADVIWTMDMSLRFTYISSSILQLRGYTVDEAMVQPFDCVIVPESLGEIMTLLTQKLKMVEAGLEEGWAPIVFEVEQPCKDGTTVWTLNNAKILQDSEKHPVGIIGVTHNITERKQSEEALRISEELFSKVFKASPQWMAITTVTDGKYLEVNDTFTKISGVTREEAIGRTLLDLNFWLNPEDRDKALSVFHKQGYARNVEIKLRLKDEKVHNLLWSADPLEFDGEECLINVLTDITQYRSIEEEKSKLEARLRQAEKMEAMGTLAGGIAHDFNNVLMGIQGRTSIMLMKKDSSHPDFEHLTGIEDNVESAADLTKQLLGFARGGKYEVNPTDINELIKKENRMFGRTKKEITIRGQYEKDLWSVEVDRGQIESR